MVIGIGIPRPIDLERTGGLTVIGVAHVREDTAVLSLELLDRIKRPAAFQARDRRVQSPAGDEQQRKARTGLLILDANGAFFIERHGSSSLPTLLTKHAPRYGHHGCGSARFQYFAPDRIHRRRPHDLRPSKRYAQPPLLAMGLKRQVSLKTRISP